jgi:hypothetical protein
MREPLTMKASAPIWRLKVVLQRVRPAIWRRFDTESTVTLDNLHEIIQGAMGWELAHLYSFHNRLGQAIRSGATLAAVARPGDSLVYLYDFGDDWQHEVTVEKAMVKPAGTYPRVVAGRNACPPEDCGGPWGYADLVKTLASRRTARRRELIEWLGGPFDPKHFDLEEANERLAEYLDNTTET